MATFSDVLQIFLAYFVEFEQDFEGMAKKKTGDFEEAREMDWGEFAILIRKNPLIIWFELIVIAKYIVCM